MSAGAEAHSQQALLAAPAHHKAWTYFLALPDVYFYHGLFTNKLISKGFRSTNMADTEFRSMNHMCMQRRCITPTRLHMVLDVWQEVFSTCAGRVLQADPLVAHPC